jgi:hypothetical protein
MWREKKNIKKKHKMVKYVIIKKKNESSKKRMRIIYGDLKST